MARLAGDLLSDVLTAIGLKKCGGCAKRQEAMNRADKKIRETFRGKKGKRA